jgi:hypothetical protein
LVDGNNKNYHISICELGNGKIVTAYSKSTTSNLN